MIFGMEISTFLGFVFLVAGFVFVGIEISMPGFSWPGVIGIASFVAAVFLFTENFITGLLISIGVVLVLGFLLIFLFDRLAKGKFKSPIVLKDATDTQSGFKSLDADTELVGKKGVLITDLRPVGKAEIEGKQYEVMSESEFLKKGSNVVVCSVKQSRIIVRAESE